jgi:hypothetical protein
VGLFAGFSLELKAGIQGNLNSMNVFFDYRPEIDRFQADVDPVQGPHGLASRPVLWFLNGLDGVQWPRRQGLPASRRPRNDQLQWLLIRTDSKVQGGLVS